MDTVVGGMVPGRDWKLQAREVSETPPKTNERVAKDRESLYGNGTQTTRSSRFLYRCGV